MTKTKAIFHLVYVIFLAVGFYGSFYWGRYSSDLYGKNSHESVFSMFVILFFFFMTFISIGLYASRVYFDDSIPPEKQKAWALLMMLGLFFVFPFYWYAHIWKKIETVDNTEAKPLEE